MKITSQNTSVNQIPALHRWYVNNATYNNETILLDYGCGKYNKGMDFLINSTGALVLGYDPYNRPEDYNNKSISKLDEGLIDVSLVANVLNVINSENDRYKVIQNVSYSNEAYFTMYEGDTLGTGRKTIKGWQENRKTNTYIEEIEKYFSNVTRKGKTIIAKHE